MRIVSEWRVFYYGFLSWAIPFAASIPFYGHEGELTVPQPLFKSLMVVIGGAVGCYLLVRTSRRVAPSLGAGLAIGALWVVINLLLDLLILVPMSEMSIGGYVQDIGLRYLLLPIIAAAIGVVAQESRVVEPGSTSADKFSPAE